MKIVAIRSVEYTLCPDLLIRRIADSTFCNDWLALLDVFGHPGGLPFIKNRDGHPICLCLFLACVIGPGPSVATFTFAAFSNEVTEPTFPLTMNR